MCRGVERQENSDGLSLSEFLAMSLRNASCWMAIIELDEVMRVAARSLHGIHADSTCSSASKWRCSRLNGPKCNTMMWASSSVMPSDE